MCPVSSDALPEPRRDATVLPPGRDSVRAARRFVMGALQSWGVDALADTAALGVSELATNAVLHVGQDFEVAVEWDGERARVEVTDASELPAIGAKTVAALDDVARSHGVRRGGALSGRGLLLVASLAVAMGERPHGDGKTVWFEVEHPLLGNPPDQVATVVQELGDVRGAGPGHVARLLGVPVDTAIASADQLDDVLRELVYDRTELGSQTAEAARAAGGAFVADATARERLALARALGRETVDLDVVVSPASLDALARLGACLEQVLQLLERGHMLSVPPDPAVVAFRRWLLDEIPAQLAGHEPRPYPSA